VTLPAAPARRVLVVEDEGLVREFLQRLLGAEGYDVRSSELGRAALEYFRLDPQAVGFVVTDINMPGLDGVDMARGMRALAPALPVLFVTGNPADMGRRFEVEIGEPVALLAKPFTPDQLMRCVRRLLEPREPQAL
jgi:CheY-like chemotaxis protein